MKKHYVAKNTNDEKSCSKEHIVTNYVLFFFSKKLCSQKHRCKKKNVAKTAYEKTIV